MLFADKRYYGIQSGSFIGNYKIAYAFLDGSIKNNKISPMDTTAIDKLKEKAILKANSEHAERLLLNVQQNKLVESINIITNKLEENNAEDFSYEPGDLYLKSDTTGTAAGLTSDEIITKAVLELLEKNEMLLLWYGKKGYFLEHNDYIKSLIKELDLKSPNIDIFVCRNLCNFYTVIAIAYDDEKVTSSGVSVSKSLTEAISLALEEAKIIEWANPFTSISKSNHTDSINHSKLLKKDLEIYNYNSPKQENLIINSFIKTLNIRILNTPSGKRPTTVKCISKELFNCLPQKERISLDYNRQILKEFDIHEDIIKNSPECILR